MKNNYVDVDMELFRQPKMVLSLSVEQRYQAIGLYVHLKQSLAITKGHKLRINHQWIELFTGLTIPFITCVIEDFDLFVVEDGWYWCEDVVKKMSEINTDTL